MLLLSHTYFRAHASNIDQSAYLSSSRDITNMMYYNKRMPEKWSDCAKNGSFHESSLVFTMPSFEVHSEITPGLPKNSSAANFAILWGLFVMI